MPSSAPYYKAGYAYHDIYEASGGDCSGEPISTLGFALDACVPIVNDGETRYLRYTCSGNYMVGTFYTTKSCIIGSEDNQKWSPYHALNQCSSGPGYGAHTSVQYRCTTNLDSLPIAKPSVVDAEYGTSACDLPAVAFEALPQDTCLSFNSSTFVTYTCSSDGKNIATKLFSDSTCTTVVGKERTDATDTCTTNTASTDDDAFWDLSGSAIPYKKRTCLTPDTPEPENPSGYFFRSLYDDEKCASNATYQDGFRLGKCLPLYSSPDGLQKGSYYATCSNTQASPEMTFLRFSNDDCLGTASSSSKVPVAPAAGPAKSVCVAAGYNQPGILRGKYLSYGCSSGGSIADLPVVIPKAVVLGGGDDYNNCTNDKSYNVFATYSTADDAFFPWNATRFTMSCDAQTWLNASNSVFYTAGLVQRCYSVATSVFDNEYDLLLANENHLVQSLLLSHVFPATFPTAAPVSVSASASARALSEELVSAVSVDPEVPSGQPQPLSHGRRLDNDQISGGFALKTYYSDGSCNAAPVFYEGYKLNTCVQRFDASTGSESGSVRYECMADGTLLHTPYTTSDCTSSSGGMMGGGGAPLPPLYTGYCTNSTEFGTFARSLQGSVSGYVGPSHSFQWSCSSNEKLLPLPGMSVVQRGFATYDESCAKNDLTPSYFTAFPADRCIALNGTSQQSVTYSCSGGRATKNTFAGQFCQSLYNTAAYGSPECSSNEEFVQSAMDALSPQKFQRTTCYNPQNWGSTVDEYAGADAFAKFSFVSLSCRGYPPSIPTEAPTEHPTDSPNSQADAPTDAPVSKPSKPSKPSSRPTPKPTSRLPPSTPAPSREEVVIDFGVSQVVNKVSLAQFNTAPALYSATLQQTIVASINSTYITLASFVSFSVAAGSSASASASSLPLPHATRGLASTSSIVLTYELSTTAPGDSSVTYASLSQALVSSVQGSKFNSLLAKFAAKNGATYLVGASAGQITVTDMSNNGNNAPAGPPKLGQPQTIVAVVFALLGSFCICCCIYYARKPGGLASCCSRRSSSSPSRYGSRGGSSYSFEDSQGLHATRAASYSYRDDHADSIPPKTTFSPQFDVYAKRGVGRLGGGTPLSSYGGRRFDDDL